MSNWESEFDNLLVACFHKEDIEGDYIKIYGKDLPTTKAFIERAMQANAAEVVQQAMKFFKLDEE